VLAQSIHFDWTMPFQIKNSGVSTGSGFFISSEGHILTCAHVVKRSMEVEVEISSEGKKRFPVDVLGVCFNQDYDIALLKIKGYKPKYHFKLSDSEKIKTGDKVRAVGFPLGSNQLKVTQGIVSGRENGSIQTDTALNPGNSGGPLLLEKSNQVVGINYSLLRGANAIGYAVPINHYYLLKNELMSPPNRKLVSRPYLGFQFNNLSQDLVKLTGSNCDKGGVYVIEVYPNSPMEKAGIRQGHIVCSLNGYSIDKHGQISMRKNEQSPLTDVIHTIKNGQEVPIEYWNGEQHVKSKLTYSDYVLPIRSRYPSFEKIDYECFGGLVVMELALNHAATKIRNRLMKYSKPKNRYLPKLVISKVLPGSDLSKQEVLLGGDIITKVNDQEVTNLKQYRIALLHPLKKGNNYYLKIETEDHEAMVLNLEQLIKHEASLVNIYKYQPSKTYRTIIKQIVKKQSGGGADQCLLL